MATAFATEKSSNPTSTTFKLKFVLFDKIVPTSIGNQNISMPTMLLVAEKSKPIGTMFAHNSLCFWIS